MTSLFALLPSRLAACALSAIGHRIHPTAKIGFSLVRVERLCMGPHSSIGHGNLISCRRLVLREKARFRHLNVAAGPFSILVGSRSLIGNRNRIRRQPFGITYGPSVLRLGKVTGITIGHSLDLTRSILIGDYTTFAGMGTQIWTHGYYHYSTGEDRFRVDGRVMFGNNVYIGSSCCISMGVHVADGIMIGAMSSVSKDLTVRGLYVSQPLRFVELDLQRTLSRLDEVAGYKLDERVYQKRESE